MKLDNHPTVKWFQEGKIPRAKSPAVLQAAALKQNARDLGSADVGLIDMDREALADYRQDLLAVLPDTRSIMVLLFRLSPIHLRSAAHSVADNEFRHAWTEANLVSRKLATQLQNQGIQAVSMPAGFPYETARWPGKIWLTCDKVFATQAGLGRMGFNRLVLHPTYGAAVILGSILLGRPCDAYDQPLDFNPCLECGLCLKVCPVGAIKSTNEFGFMACYSHNYRERLGGFQNWVEQIAASKNAADYRRRVSDWETISMWQHLAIGAQTRCDRCMAVCPAGERAVGEFLDDRIAYARRYLSRWNDLEETVFVVRGSDAEKHVRSKFPNKSVRYISNGIRPTSAASFLSNLPLAFQPGQSEGLNAVFHFTFTGHENVQSTVIIKEKRIAVQAGLIGRPDLHVIADSGAWVRFLAKELHLVKALVSRKLKIKGSPKLMAAFAKCFPS